MAAQEPSFSLVNDRFRAVALIGKEQGVTSIVDEVNHRWCRVKALINARIEEEQSRLTLLQEFETNVRDLEECITCSKVCMEEHQKTKAAGINGLEDLVSMYAVSIL